jgi:hypothetical protein
MLVDVSHGGAAVAGSRAREFFIRNPPATRSDAR